MPTGSTIIALASPEGFSPRAIIRVSGSATRQMLLDTIGCLPPPRRAQHARFHLESTPLQGAAAFTPTLPVLVLYFQAPRSYTGQDAAEILLPGNPHLIERVMSTLLAVPGVRRADPGEFSARAYLNNKLTLAQAEGIAQLIAATNERQRRAAQQLMRGVTSQRYHRWTDETTTLLALVEAGIDFTDQEDVVAIDPAELSRRLATLARDIDDHLGARAGTHVSDRLPVVVLIGQPNAGKSTLFNALLGRRRAVTSPHAGTTRDVLREPLDLSSDLPGAGAVTLVDLAGLCAHADSPIDSESQSHAAQAIADADVAVFCDPTGRFGHPPPLRPDATVIRVRTKGDLPGKSDKTSDSVSVCALDGWNLSVLRRAIADAATGSASTGVLPRHRRALLQARRRLDDAAALIDQPRADAPELIAGSLRAALDALGELIGRISPDDVIGRIFATFCVGK